MERNLAADLLKGFAILFMIQVHILELFSTQEIYESFYGSILLFLGGPPAAPVFMIVMGYYISQGNNNYRDTLMRGAKLIGLGMLLNIGLNFHLFIRIFTGEIVASPWPYLFGVDILFLAGLSIIFLGVIRSFFGKNPLLYFLLILAIFFIGNFIPAKVETTSTIYFTSFFYGNSWWSYFPIIPWLAYPLTGLLFQIIEPRLIRININNYYYWGIISLSGVILFVTINYGIMVASDLHNYYHHDYMYFLFISNFMIFWTGIMKLISKLPNNPIIRYFQWMGKNVTIFYVIQWLIIGNIATALYKTQNAIESVFWLIGITISTSLITYIWNKFVNNNNVQNKSIILK